MEYRSRSFVRFQMYNHYNRHDFLDIHTVRIRERGVSKNDREREGEKETVNMIKIQNIQLKKMYLRKENV